MPYGGDSHDNNQNLQVERGERERQMLETVSTNIENVQLVAIANLRRQLAEAVLSQREDAQVDQVANFGRQELQPVAVQVEVGDPGQVADLGRHLRQEVLGDHQLLQADAQPQVGVQGHKPVLIDLEDCQLGQSSDGVGQSFEQVL